MRIQDHGILLHDELPPLAIIIGIFNNLTHGVEGKNSPTPQILKKEKEPSKLLTKPSSQVL